VSIFIPEVILVYKFFTKKMSSVKRVKITLRANLLVFVVACFALGLATLFDVNFLYYKAPMPYNDWKTIQWSDFRAIKHPGEKVEESVHFASIFSEIRAQMADNETVSVVTYFHPARSYTYSENQIGESLLTHELYHLHISEYYARLIRKEITTIASPVDKSVLYKTVENYKKQEKEMQLQYDSETDHSYISGKQKEWQHKIDSCLSSLSIYSNETIKF
jgi:hypothetical protein